MSQNQILNNLRAIESQPSLPRMKYNFPPHIATLSVRRVCVTIPFTPPPDKERTNSDSECESDGIHRARAERASASGKCKLLDSDNYANAAGMTRSRRGAARGTPAAAAYPVRRWIYANTVFSSVTREKRDAFRVELHLHSEE